MKALVTGGAGFIGSHVVDALLDNGLEVHVLDNLVTGNTQNINPHTVFCQMDIREKDLESYLGEIVPDIVYHLAAQVSVPKSFDDPVYDADVNIMGTINLLEACANVGVKRVVFSSSAAVYGLPKVLPISEKHELCPISYYGISKAIAEQYLHFYWRQFGLEYMILRYANVYGPRQDVNGEGGVVSIFIDRAKKNKPLRIFGKGDQTRDFIYVKDVVAANLAASRCYANMTLNIGTQTSTSVNELVRVIEAASQSVCDIEYSFPRTGDILHSILDINQGLNEMAWRPVYTIEAGITEMMQF